MTKIVLTVAYDGTDFHGFARQVGQRTVQGTMEDVLSRIVGTPVLVTASGRTDAGVHAMGQVVHWYQTDGPPVERYVYLLRRSLPQDILAISAHEGTDDFHSRFSATGKTYIYRIQMDRLEDIYTRRYTWHMWDTLQLQLMRETAAFFVGEHDFTSFCKAASPVEDKQRRIYAITLTQVGSYLDIAVSGSGFLQHMVRIIVGTLVDVGLGKMTPSGALAALQGRDRTLAGRTAPAKGLHLCKVYYTSTLPLAFPTSLQ